MKNIKFVVRVSRGGTHSPEYVQRVDPAPIHMTANRKLALVMGKFTAEDAVKSIQNSRAHPGVSARTGGCLAFVLKMITRTYLHTVRNCGQSNHGCQPCRHGMEGWVKYGQLSFDSRLDIRSRAHTLPVQSSRTSLEDFMEYFRLDHPPNRLILCNRSNCEDIADFPVPNRTGADLLPKIGLI